METQPATIRAIYRRLFSRKIRFQSNSGTLLDRLDDITRLIYLRDTEPTLAFDLHNAILSGLETIKDLSFYLRDFILQLDVDHVEFRFLTQILQHQEKIKKVCEFDYVIAYEWSTDRFNPKTQLTEHHQGDLVLMNEAGSFLVVELKHIKPDNDFDSMVERGTRIRQVRKQTQKFLGFFRERFPWAHAEGLALTNFGSYRPDSKKPVQRLKGIL